MKKPITVLLLVVTTILAFTFSGCEEINPIEPGEDNDLHPMLWQYNYNQHQIHADVLPAMDENGNLFFSIQNDENAKEVYVFANDKDGQALWHKNYSSSNHINISRIMYIDNKVFYTVLVFDELEYYQETIYCLNAEDGSQIWKYSPDFNWERNITAMAVTPKYLIVSAVWGADGDNTGELHYFDVSSGALLKSIDLGYDQVSHISIAGENIYLGAYYISSKSYSAPKVMKMNLESNEIEWSFHPEYENDVAYTFEQKNIAIDNNGRVFCIIRTNHGVDQSKLYIINDGGILENTISSPENNKEIYDLLIDKNNNFYVAIPTFTKYSPDGTEVWQFYSSNTLPNDNFITGSILADNDTIYHAEQGGILNVNSDGTIAWAVYDQTNFTKPGYPVLNNEGNMIVVGDEYVSCFKGDGAKIQNAPWPRVFCNNGNTASR